jgi:hypothetical protein
MRKITSMVNFATNFFKEETQKILLGRWSINYCPIKIKKNIDAGNNDHCGTCQFIKLQEKYDKEDDNDDIIINNNKSNKKIMKDME